jgi:hypothetical protein
MTPPLLLWEQEGLDNILGRFHNLPPNMVGQWAIKVSLDMLQASDPS